MKKTLLATTALVGFAGAAAAEITLSGYAEIGVNGGNTSFATPAGYETQFHNDFHINFNFSGTTDGGVEFGGKVQIEENNGPDNINGTPRIDDEHFWVSGSFGKVSLGETDGAVDWAVPDIFTGTSLTDDHSTHAGVYWNTGLDGNSANGGGNQIMRYEYSFGDWAAAMSLEMNDDAAVDQDPSLSLGAKWAGDLSGVDVSAGIGYATDGDDDTWSLGGRATMANGFGIALGYADFSNSTDPNADNFHLQDYVTGVNATSAGTGRALVEVESWYGIGVSYTAGALTLGANYGSYSAANPADGDPNGWGLVANYDLGGGAVAMVGYGQSSGSDAAGIEYGSGNGHGTETWSAGLGMSF
jgi:outer membrane protein OmpU